MAQALLQVCGGKPPLMTSALPSYMQVARIYRELAAAVIAGTRTMSKKICTKILAGLSWVLLHLPRLRRRYKHRQTMQRFWSRRRRGLSGMGSTLFRNALKRVGAA